MGGGLPFPIVMAMSVSAVVIFSGLVWWLLLVQRDRSLRKYSVPFALFAMSAAVMLFASYYGHVRPSPTQFSRLSLAGIVLVAIAGSFIVYWGRKPREKARKKSSQKY